MIPRNKKPVHWSQWPIVWFVAITDANGMMVTQAHMLGHYQTEQEARAAQQTFQAQYPTRIISVWSKGK